MKKTHWVIAVIGVIVLATSCQKIINIDLNSANPAIVIVGNINDQPGPYTVTLSQTVNFSQPNTFPGVSGALVTVSDNTGIIDTLTETTTPGTYNTHKTIGIQGRTYTLNVTANGKTYTAVSTMPQKVNFDTLVIEQKIGGAFRNTNDTSYIPEIVFQDPAAVTNYYRFIEIVNDTLLTNVNALNDKFFNGRYIAYPLRHKLNVGDSVNVEMQCIDYGTYEYLSTLGEASGGTTGVTPANPVSNISNNALGYFSAHTSQYRSVQVVR